MNRFLATLSLILALVIFATYIDPMWTGSIATTQAAIANDNKALTAAQEYTKREKELVAARDAINPAYLARLNTLLPGDVNDVGLILDLTGLAARAGISLTSIDASVGNQSSPQTALSAVGNSSLGSLDLSLSFAGTYNALRKFIAGMEQSARLLDVRNITINSSPTGVYTYSMSVRLYWLR